MKVIKAFTKYNISQAFQRDSVCLTSKQISWFASKAKNKEKNGAAPYSEKKEQKENMEFEGDYDHEFNEDIMELFNSNEEVNEESILHKVKQCIEQDSQFTPMQLARIQHKSEIEANMQSYLEDYDENSEERFEKSKKISQALRLKKDMSFVRKAKRMEQYGNYQDFSDVNMMKKEKSFSKFKETEDIVSRSYSQDLRTGSLVRTMRDYDIDHDDDEEIDLQLYIQSQAYISYQARREIYKLHLDGWSNRQLSVRYGIVPERVKAIIFCEQYFESEIQPFLQPVDVYRMNRDLDKYDEISGSAVEYGVDLPELAERERYLPNLNFDERDIEKHREKINKNELDHILKQTRKNKHEWVYESFAGVGTKGVFIKNWVKYRGKGRETISSTFRQILHFSHKPYLLKDRVRIRLEKGPRVASFGLRK